jgi:lipoprotein NlpD
VRAVRIIGLAACVCWWAAGCVNNPVVTTESYVVQPRDTLYSIAWRHDLDYRDLARWNHIGPEFRITVGQVLTLKPGNSRGAPATAAGRAAAGPPRDAAVPRDAAASSAAPRNGAGPDSAASPGDAAQSFLPPAAAAGQPCGPEPAASQRWSWPTAPASAPRPVPGGGILMLGTFGQPIRAACAGRVVYAGSGIRGYGNLIIIKHGEKVLSAYAHTVEIAVREGQEVATGEQIARMGTGAHDIAALYFEIRLNGKPVDPRPFLPSAPLPPSR